MRYVKTAGLLALSLVAMMVGAGGAWGTNLTDTPPPPSYTGAVKAEAEKAIQMDGTIVFACQKSTLEWNVESHGASVTTKGALTKFSLEECGNATVTVAEPGSLELHATGNGNGTLTSADSRITVLTHSLFLGTTHCIYETNNTHIGTLTGSRNTGGTATLDIGAAPIPEVATDELCSEDALLTGNYKFTSPDYLDVD